jgi:mycothiol synthase
VPSVTVERPLRADNQARVRALAGEFEARYGTPQLNDQTLSRLGVDDESLLHVLMYDDMLVGYAQLEVRPAIAEAEAAVRPGQHDQLLTGIERLAGKRQLRIWAHGEHSPLSAVLEARGYRRERVLWQLRRPLADLPAPAPLPSGVTLRAFVPGQDELAWLAINAAAFSQHAEQGGWTLRDLQAREAEAWFDATGFLLAEQDGKLVGFHWTKVHSDGLGEVYVLGISPAAKGLHLGRALLDAGLGYLAGRGCATVLLYVDDDNASAMRLYDRAGFHRHDVDIRYLRRAGSPLRNQDV